MSSRVCIKFHYNIFFTFLMVHGLAPNGICSEGGVHVMLLEVGQASHVVLTKSESRNYQRRTQFE